MSYYQSSSFINEVMALYSYMMNWHVLFLLCCEEYIQDHWMEDDFFGYQLLNGYNPMAIQRCNQLPCKFAVTDEMVKPFLERGSSLTTEMQVRSSTEHDNITPLTSNSEQIYLKPSPGESL